MTTHHFLENYKLGSWEEKINGCGYGNEGLTDFLAIGKEDLEALCKECGIKFGHRNQLKKAIKQEKSRKKSLLDNAYFAVGATLIMEGRLKKAFDDYKYLPKSKKQAFPDPTKDPKVLNYAARILLANKKFQEALAYILKSKKLAETEEDRLVVYEVLQKIYWKQEKMTDLMEATDWLLAFGKKEGTKKKDIFVALARFCSEKMDELDRSIEERIAFAKKGIKYGNIAYEIEKEKGGVDSVGAHATKALVGAMNLQLEHLKQKQKAEEDGVCIIL